MRLLHQAAIFLSCEVIPTRSVDHQNAEIGAANRSFGAHDAEYFDRGVMPAAWANAGGIDENESFSRPRRRRCRPRLVLCPESR